MSVAGKVGAVFSLVCLALLCGLLVLVNQRDAARQDAATWQAGAQANAAALEGMKEDKARLEKALKGRDEELAALKLERDAQRRELREAMRNDKAASDWGGAAVPDAVLRLLK